MYDNELNIDPRLAIETGFYPNGELVFTPAREGNEDELKFLVRNPYKDFGRIIGALRDKGNRTVDPRSFSSKEKALVTLNLDTVDPKTGRPTQLIRGNGYSMRVRFEVDPGDLTAPISKIDFSVKTRSSDSNVIFLHGQRGEWEAPLNTLSPSLAALRAHNKHSGAKGRRALPDLFKSRTLADNMFRVESIGVCWRTTYVSTHRKTDEPRAVAAVYDHTEDFNLFTTPYADIITQEDAEAEAEFKGLVSDTAIENGDYDRIMKWSVQRTAKLINGCSRTIIANPISKASRASAALHTPYLACCFEGVAENPHEYALLQNVRPEDVRLDNLAGHLQRLKSQRDRNMGIIMPEPKQQYK